MRLSLLLRATLGLLAAPWLALQSQPAAPRAILVTGASSGLGRAIAERLAKEGFFVYAGARQAADLAELSAIPNMRGIRLDVTSTPEVDSALALITREGRGLYGVVNNAGIVTGGALISTSDDDLRRMLDVNVMGSVRVTRAAAPLLMAARGRVVTISSLSGIVSQPMLGVYSMTKHATEAFGDALGAEMAPLGVTSSLIEPGNYRSEIGANAMPALQAAAERAKGTPFERAMQNFVRSMGTFATNPPPDSVAAAALDAFTSPSPKPRYLVVPEASQQLLTVRRAIEELVQLNAGSTCRYDREQLVKLLDEALAKRR
jgi:NAD(P)-dependent dehydrogenase (short-subunit alcohol dehydrogenase family)